MEKKFPILATLRVSSRTRLEALGLLPITYSLISISKRLWRAVKPFLRPFLSLDLLRVPMRTASNLAKCRYISLSDASRFPHFTIPGALAALFYSNTYECKQRHGKDGIAPELGFGDFNLSFLSHFTRISFGMYKQYGIYILVGSMFIWWLTNGIWLADSSPAWTLCAMLIVLMGTTFHAQLFYLQNYNGLGWALFPLFLWALHTNEWILAGGLVLVFAFTSVTVAAFSILLMISGAILNWSFWPLAATLPAGCKLATHALPFLSKKNGKTLVRFILTSIGTKTKTRTLSYSSFFQYPARFQFIINFQFFVVAALLAPIFPAYFLVGLILFGLRYYGIRFADDYGYQILLLSLAFPLVATSENILVFLSFILVASPLTYFSETGAMLGTESPIPSTRPIDTTTLLAPAHSLLRRTKSGDRILFGFSDPEGLMDNLWDGLFYQFSCFVHAGFLQNTLVLPNSLAVFEIMNGRDMTIWGRDPDTLYNNAVNLGCSHVCLSYAASKSMDDPRFAHCGSLDDKKLSIWLETAPPSKEELSWHLYQVATPDVQKMTGIHDSASPQ